MSALPELLSPAGSSAALEAAVEAGADAVYFGGSAFNARMNAANFDKTELQNAIRTAHGYGVRCYVTLNTLIFDRELSACLDAAVEYANAGADGLIVADVGVASSIHRLLPELPLHASTQASGHNISAAAELSKLGFSRMVMAREASLDDIRRFTSTSQTELEVFIHGALCVSCSGQCLFSSLVGGRSGNRGECAQPCRLPYKRQNGKEYYPLSLKDLCLAKYIPELIDARVSSLKIEGRMKPPEYVLAVTRVYRRLLDEHRAATNDELSYLAGIFSRDGFTDGYFTKNITGNMLGVRSEADKSKTRTLPPFTGITRRVKLGITAEIHAGLPTKLTLDNGIKCVTVYGDTPQTALTSPMTDTDYLRSLTRFGGTPYEAGQVTLFADSGLMLPVSRLNALRRSALEALEPLPHNHQAEASDKPTPTGKHKHELTARFVSPKQLTESAKRYFDRIYLPLENYNGETDAVIMPPVIYDRDAERFDRLLADATEKGAKHILVGNIGHITLAEKHGFILHGDFRLNITNSASVAALEGFGIVDFILSPELTLPQIRDLQGDTSAIVYGRIPLMLLEKCVIRETDSGCQRGNNCSGELVDRRGAVFPVLCESDCRNVIYNSLPTAMSDRQSDLASAGITARHFIFSTETPDEVDRIIDAYRNSTPLGITVRRIK